MEGEIRWPLLARIGLVLAIVTVVGAIVAAVIAAVVVGPADDTQHSRAEPWEIVIQR